MSLLKNVTKGKIAQPFSGVIYGIDGTGKSSFGAEMPSPLFLGAERGTANLDVSRLSVASFDEVLGVVKELTDSQHGFESLVIDSLDWLEPLVWERVVERENESKIKSIEDFGYGKGYALALDEWRKLLSAISRLREKKPMHFLAIAHAEAKNAKDPTVLKDYDHYQLKLNAKAAALWREFVDNVFFLNYETHVATDSKGKSRALGDGERFFYTEWRPAFDAKNRFGLDPRIPYEKGMGWRTLWPMISSTDPLTPEAMLKSIDGLLIQSQDESVKARVLAAVEKHKHDASELERIYLHLRNIVYTPAAS